MKTFLNLIKRLNIFVFIVFLTFNNNTFGQKSYIRGYVKDSETKEPLPGATVLLEGTKIGVPTDLDGSFKIDKINPGNYRVVVSYVSYEKYIRDIKIKEGDSLNLSIF